MRTRTRMTLAGLALGAIGMISGSALAVVPVAGTTPTLTPITINSSPGDQNDPHVSGDWAAYTDFAAIRYYNFSTGADAQIPLGSSARDLLSDISGSKVVFSRIITGVKNAVMVFDAATGAAPLEIDPAAATNRLGSAIGGDTVAWVDFGLHANGELVLHDLVSTHSVRITNDAAFDQNPQISPDGTVVVWEHCATSSTNCDIWQARRATVAWSVGALSDSASAESNPDTNGTLVTYDSLRAGNGDVFWRPVTGAAEVQLQLPGFEVNPSIAGDSIAFESRPTLFDTTDLFVYDVVDNRLFQLTDTPFVTEQLSDIAVLPDGAIRVVWASDEDGFDQRNIRGATFRLRAADSTAPVLHVPSAITASATTPAGATVSYVVTATDDVTATPTVSCAPASGSTFPIGTSTVSCTATDAAGNSSTASFEVVVLGAPDQITTLIALVESFNLKRGIENSLDVKLRGAQDALAAAHAGDLTSACNKLGAFVHEVEAQSGKALTTAEASQLVTAATQIKAALGCP